MGEKPSIGPSGSSTSYLSSEQKAAVTERLTLGRDRIKRGWCKGRYNRGSEEGQILSYCMLGSILNETGLLDQITRRAGLVLLDSIDVIYGKFVYDDLVTFNDDPIRKKLDVIQVFNRSIQALGKE